VGAEKVRVESDRCNPVRNEPSILPGGQATAVITTPTEKKLARFLASGQLLGQLRIGRADHTAIEFGGRLPAGQYTVMAEIVVNDNAMSPDRRKAVEVGNLIGRSILVATIRVN
jgi:hypothetical protein